PYTAPANGSGSAFSGNISVTPTLNGCVGSAQVFTITVSPTPLITLTPTDPTTCNGNNGSILVTGTGSGTVTWSGTASGTNASANLNFAINGLSAGNYNVFFINGSTGCQSATLPTTLNNPGAPVINPLTSILNCGTSYTIPAITGTNLVNPVYYTLPGGPSGGGSVVSVGSTYSAPSNVMLYAYDANGTCTDEEPLSVTINSLPTASLSGGAIYCAGQTVNNVAATVTGAGNWTVNYTLNGTPQSASGNTSPISLGNAPGTYVLTGVTDANCTNTATGTQTITVNPLPTATLAGGNTYCAGAAVSNIEATVTGSPNWTVTYTLNGGSPQTISGGASPISLGNAPGVYVITSISDANCTNTAAGTQTITVNALPTASISGGAVYCAGQVVNNISAAVTGVANWTVNYTLNGAPQSATGNSSPISLGNTPGTYILTGVTDANCTNTATGTQTITVNPLPTATIAGGGVYCTGETVGNVNVAATGAGNWAVNYTLNGIPQTSFGNTSPITLGNAPGTYVLTGISDLNCSNTATGSQTITVNQLPLITALSGGAIYCAGAPIANIEATVTGSPNWSISYTLDGVPQPVVTGSSSPISLGNSGGTYSVTSITDANCTNTVTGSQTITINALPAVVSLNGGADYCPGALPAPITADVTGSPTYSIVYTLNGGAPQTATGASSTITIGNAPGTYVLTSISDLNCTNTANGTQTITINPTPVIALTVTDPSVCSATDGSILVSGTGAGTVVWSGETSGSDAAATLDYTIPALGNGNYSVYFIDGTTGCQSSTESAILTDPNAPIITPVANAAVCDSYTLPS
ncbi:MAG: beta strand repeat-containing protein, partial [Bacteroidota bacterium]